MASSSVMYIDANSEAEAVAKYRTMMQERKPVSNGNSNGPQCPASDPLYSGHLVVVCKETCEVCPGGSIDSRRKPRNFVNI